MDINKLKDILKEHNLYIKETRKNIISCCVFCGDHKNIRKRGHLYISLDENIPVSHCFLCGKSTTIRNLLKEINNDSKLIDQVITLQEQNKNLKEQSNKIIKKEQKSIYQLPEIDFDSFKLKRLYIRQRTCNNMEAENVPNLIFDFATFFRINNIDMVGDDKQIGNVEFDYLQRNFVGFLGRNHSMIFCRNIDTASSYKFKKIHLQNNYLLDYWSLNGYSNNSTVVLSEANFNILSEYCFDFLNMKKDVRLYVSGNSFSYSSLLKSVCYDEDLYKCNVIILSDNDKNFNDYRKFVKDNSHIITTLQIWGNDRGKDWGEFPVNPFLYKSSAENHGARLYSH